MALYIREGTVSPCEGAELNHRGGLPGFIFVDSPSRITVSDY